MVINAIVRNLELKSSLKIIASPHHRNIRYSVVDVENDDPVNVCMPLVNELKSKGKEMDRAMVFCQRLNHVRLLYRFIDNEMINAGVAAKCYEKYQGNTEENVKKTITDSFTKDNGLIRLLIASVAFGMGVDCKGLHLVVHYGPPNDIDYYCQETGRAGCDGSQSHAVLIMYPKAISKNTSQAMREYCKNKSKCRREMIFHQFKGTFEKVTPLHQCCDICACKCVCDSSGEKCALQDNSGSYESTFEQAIKAVLTPMNDVTNIDCNCVLTEEGRNLLSEKLSTFRNSLIEGKEKSQLFSGYEIASGFPLMAIQEIVNNASNMTCADDILKKTCIFDADLCNPIYSMVRDVISQNDLVMVELTTSNDGLSKSCKPNLETVIPETTEITESETVTESAENTDNETSDELSDDSLTYQKNAAKYRITIASDTEDSSSE